MWEKERRRFFVEIAARERVVPREIRLLQIKITTEQAGREAFGKNRRKRIPLQKRLANGDTGKKFFKENGNGKKRNKAFKKRG